VKQVVCAVVLVFGVLTGGAVPAHADLPATCVNRGEYRQVHQGMTMRRVHRIFDGRGRRTAFSRHGRFTSEIRRYRGCPHRSAVSVSYGNGRVRSKSASW